MQRQHHMYSSLEIYTDIQAVPDFTERNDQFKNIHIGFMLSK